MQEEQGTQQCPISLELSTPARILDPMRGFKAGRPLRYPGPSEADRGHTNPCSAARNSLFSAVGNAMCKPPYREENQARWPARRSPNPREFPVFSRGSGNWRGETSSLWTALSANQSARAETSRPERDPSAKSPPFRGPWGEPLRASQAETTLRPASPRRSRAFSLRAIEAVG